MTEPAITLEQAKTLFESAISAQGLFPLEWAIEGVSTRLKFCAPNQRVIGSILLEPTFLQLPVSVAETLANAKVLEACRQAASEPACLLPEAASA